MNSVVFAHNYIYFHLLLPACCRQVFVPVDLTYLKMRVSQESDKHCSRELIISGSAP